MLGQRILNPRTEDPRTEDPRTKDPRIKDPVHGLEFCLRIHPQQRDRAKRFLLTSRFPLI